MVQIKIIRNDTKLIERDVNEWLHSLSLVRDHSFQIMDIKFDHINELDKDVVMIIYNVVKNTT